MKVLGTAVELPERTAVELPERAALVLTAEMET